jgi:hypothetical protein
VSKREVAVSSYVKLIRLHDMEGKLKESDMLEEFIRAEESEKFIWDSNILTRAPQRFIREMFLRILKAEILLQIQKNKINNIKMKKLIDHKSYISGIEKKIILDDNTNVIRSQKRYLDRKQFAKQYIVDAGLALKGSRVSIVDDKDRYTYVNFMFFHSSVCFMYIEDCNTP